MQVPSRSIPGVYLKAIYKDYYLFICIININKGQKSRIPGIYWPYTV